MTRKRRFALRVAGLVALLALMAPGAGPPASAVERAPSRLDRLEKIILQQQRRLAAQERRLSEQRRSLADQRRRLAAQEKKTRERFRVFAPGNGYVLLEWNELQNLRGGAKRPRALSIMTPDGRVIDLPRSARRRLLVAAEPEPREPTPVAPETGDETKPTEKTVPKAPVEKKPARKKPSGKKDKKRAQPGSPDESRPKAQKPREQALLERGAILLRRGTLQVEPSIDFSHFSANRVAINGFTVFEAIVIGTIRVDDLNRDIVTGAVTTRYGITDRVQIDLRVPGVYRKDSEVLGVGTPDIVERIISGFGLGDLEAALSVQPLIGGGAVPDIIVRVQGRFPTGRHSFEIATEPVGAGGEVRLVEPPTGSGFYAAGATTTLVWTIDPVVMFFGGGYTVNFQRDFGGAFGLIQPGDTLEFFGGLNLAINERVSINFSFVDQITQSTSQNGVKQPGTSFNDARLTVGTSIGLWSRISLLASASIGLTEESPDFQVTVSLPITFTLF